MGERPASLAQLTHPNIASVYEVGRDGDTLYSASKFIEGATLADWIEAHPLTPRPSCFPFPFQVTGCALPAYLDSVPTVISWPCE